MIIDFRGLHWVRGYERVTPVVVLCHGCYDILTVSHIRHLEFAKSRGDILVVSVTGDRYVNKGKNRPHFKDEHRAKMLSALNCVDYVTVSNFENALPIINALKPHVYVKGMDTKITETFKQEREAVEKHHGRVVFSPNVWEQHTSDVMQTLRTE